MEDNFIFVYSTIDTIDKAKTIAKELIENNLAACINIIPNVISLYQWQGKAEEGNELIMLIKTHESKYQAISTKIKEMHHYDIPAILKINIADVEKNFAKWLANSINLS